MKNFFRARTARRASSARRGFTLIEIVVASGLGALLAAVLASVWSGLGRPLVDASIRARLAQEATLAIATLAHDFSGSLSTDGNELGALNHGKLVGRMDLNNGSLRLCFDGGDSPDGIADWGSQRYRDRLRHSRWPAGAHRRKGGTTFVAANCAQLLEVSDVPGGVQIKLTLARCAT